jgi:starch phosphorylase
MDPDSDIPELYYKLERVVLPMYYGMPYKWAEVQRAAIAVNGSYFNTQRMVMQYVQNAYVPGAGADALLAMPTA